MLVHPRITQLPTHVLQRVLQLRDPVLGRPHVHVQLAQRLLLVLQIRLARPDVIVQLVQALDGLLHLVALVL
ncbi:MAG: hypothetical protein ACK559_25580, partial [bacterium]